MSLHARSRSPPHKKHRPKSYRAAVRPIHPGGMQQGSCDGVRDLQPGPKPPCPAGTGHEARAVVSCDGDYPRRWIWENPAVSASDGK